MKIVASLIAVVGVLFSVFVPAALAKAEAPRSISHGCYGGFTGGGAGVTVRSDGAILRSSRPTYRDPLEESVVGSDPQAALRLFADLDQIKFADIVYNKVGNMTCSLSLLQGTAAHTVTWEYGDSSVPSLVVEFASRLEQLALQVESN